MTKPRILHDKFFQRAKAAGYRARSVFKLEEIQNNFHLIQPTDNILDLGASPGSFLQYLVKITTPPAKLIGVDLTPMHPIHPRVQLYTGDIFDESLMNKIFIQNNLDQVDVITSDLSPKTSGIKDLDEERSLELNFQTVALAERYLKKGGHLLLKVFQGGDFIKLLNAVRKRFQQTKVYKPHASRDASRETYIIGLGKIANPR